jgi:intracellular septation protein
MSNRVPPSVETPEADTKQALKMLLELAPLGVFGLIYWRTGNVFWGIGCFMAATAIALVASRVMFGRIPVMPLVSGLAVMVFGGLTLWLQDETFIKVKPTIVNLLFAGVLLGGLAFGRPLIKYVFGEAFKLTDDGWRLLTLRWGCFFIALALLNEIVWRSFSTAFWWSFKAWGMMPLTLIFAVAQIGLIRKYAVPDTTQDRP